MHSPPDVRLLTTGPAEPEELSDPVAVFRAAVVQSAQMVVAYQVSYELLFALDGYRYVKSSPDHFERIDSRVGSPVDPIARFAEVEDFLEAPGIEVLAQGDVARELLPRLRSAGLDFKKALSVVFAVEVNAALSKVMPSHLRQRVLESVQVRHRTSIDLALGADAHDARDAVASVAEPVPFRSQPIVAGVGAPNAPAVAVEVAQAYLRIGALETLYAGLDLTGYELGDTNRTTAWTTFGSAFHDRVDRAAGAIADKTFRVGMQWYSDMAIPVEHARVTAAQLASFEAAADLLRAHDVFTPTAQLATLSGWRDLVVRSFPAPLLAEDWEPSDRQIARFARIADRAIPDSSFSRSIATA